MPEDWRKAIIVLLYKGKGNREECNNYRGISLLSVPRTIYGRILNDRMVGGDGRKKNRKAREKEHNDGGEYGGSGKELKRTIL